MNHIAYILTDTLGTSGTLTVDSDTALREAWDWFGMSRKDAPETYKTFRDFLQSLGTRTHRWDEELADLLHLTVEAVTA